MRESPSVHPLERECHVFSLYLTGSPPSPYVQGKYRDAHEKLSALEDPDRDPFDALLIVLARSRPVLCRLVDAYARVFFRQARVRTKLVVLLAILECCPTSQHHFDVPESCGKAIVALRMVFNGLTFLGSLLITIPVLHPTQLVLRWCAARSFSHR